MPRPRGGYRNTKGALVPGCTTIIGRFKETGGLLQWAFQQGRSGAESLYEESDKAADIGTHAHALYEAHCKKLQPPPAPAGMSPLQIAAAETAYLNALEWEKQVQLEAVATEVSLVCECHQFGCTIDQIARLRGKLTDIEWKTSNSIYLDHLLQIAAQWHCWNCNHPAKPLEGAAVIRWGKEYGDFHYSYFGELQEPLEQFVRLRQAYDCDRKLKRRVG